MRSHNVWYVYHEMPCMLAGVEARQQFLLGHFFKEEEKDQFIEHFKTKHPDAVLVERCITVPHS